MGGACGALWGCVLEFHSQGTSSGVRTWRYQRLDAGFQMSSSCACIPCELACFFGPEFFNQGFFRTCMHIIACALAARAVSTMFAALLSCGRTRSFSRLSIVQVAPEAQIIAALATLAG